MQKTFAALPALPDLPATEERIDSQSCIDGIAPSSLIDIACCIGQSPARPLAASPVKGSVAHHSSTRSRRTIFIAQEYSAAKYPWFAVRRAMLLAIGLHVAARNGARAGAAPHAAHSTTGVLGNASPGARRDG
ncbi:hypothetical protein BpKM376_03060 [Burkholderia pseudomallei]|nr:hypothetical protein GTC254T_03070 [Burkholderia pseudomallei]BEH41120.1 hypothetical protein KNG_03210 [Burkholderia pseudomallei]BEH53127.1 hypothetical protein BpKM376_03060 [Burkholderia pseudomallei]BEH65185.1 hypothetical protein BpKM391_02600 [Burkholderia pseudomallei]